MLDIEVAQLCLGAEAKGGAARTVMVPARPGSARTLVASVDIPYKEALGGLLKGYVSGIWLRVRRA